MGISKKIIGLAVLAPLMADISQADMLNNEGWQYRAALRHGEVRLGGEYRIFRDSLDVLGFQERREGVAIGKYDTWSLGGAYKPFEDISFSIEHNQTKGVTTRSTRPFTLEAKLKEWAASVEYDLTDTFSLSLYGETQRQDPVVIDCLDFSGISLGGTCENVDFRFSRDGDALSVASFETSSDSIGLMSKYRFEAYNVNWVQTARFQYSQIGAKVQSPLFDIESPVLLNLRLNRRQLRDIRDEYRLDVPQTNAWQAYTVALGLGGEAKIIDGSVPVFMHGGIEAFYVKRSNFVESLRFSNHNFNIRLDLGLAAKLHKNIEWTIRGYASTNYTLGFEPILYNRRSSYLFARAYGELATGITLRF